MGSQGSAGSERKGATGRTRQAEGQVEIEAEVEIEVRAEIEGEAETEAEAEGEICKKADEARLGDGRRRLHAGRQIRIALADHTVAACALGGIEAGIGATDQ